MELDVMHYIMFRSISSSFYRFKQWNITLFHFITLHSVVFRQSKHNLRDSSYEDDTTLRNCCRDVFNNIPDNTSEDSHKASSQRREFNEEDHVCFKASKENDDVKVTSISYDQMVKQSIKFYKLGVFRNEETLFLNTKKYDYKRK